MEDYKRLLELCDLCTEVHVFEFDGMLVRGYRIDVVKQYLKENPSKKFRIWLVDSGLVIREQQ